jgi:hypothetical protein
MSVEDLVDTEESVEEGEARSSVGSDGSLRDRMATRSRDLEAQATQRFSVPGYDDMIELELRTLGWDKIRRISDRHVRRRDQGIRDLYVAADVLLAATVRFHALGGGPLESGWVELARNAKSSLPENVTPRQSVLSLLRADRTTAVIDLWNEWGEWNGTQRTTLGEELGEDFTRTR